MRPGLRGSASHQLVASETRVQRLPMSAASRLARLALSGEGRLRATQFGSRRRGGLTLRTRTSGSCSASRSDMAGRRCQLFRSSRAPTSLQAGLRVPPQFLTGAGRFGPRVVDPRPVLAHIRNFRMQWRLAIAALCTCFGATVPAANAAPIALNQWYGFLFRAPGQTFEGGTFVVQSTDPPSLPAPIPPGHSLLQIRLR